MLFLVYNSHKKLILRRSRQRAAVPLLTPAGSCRGDPCPCRLSASPGPSPGRVSPWKVGLSLREAVGGAS